MQFRGLKLFVFVLVLCGASAGRFSSGSRSGGYKSGGGHSRGGSVYRPPPVSRPTGGYRPSSGTSQGNVHRQPTTDFLRHESGRPSAPKPVSTPGQRPTAPVFSGNTHQYTPPNNKPVVHDTHQQSSIGTSHSNPYDRQPATNPNFPNKSVYTPSGGYGGVSNGGVNNVHQSSHPIGGSGGIYNGAVHGSNIPAPPNGISVPKTSAPYPIGNPNHPHPNPSIGSSSYPSSNTGPLIHPSTQTQVHNAGPPPPYQQHPPPYQQYPSPYPQHPSPYPQHPSPYPQHPSPYPQYQPHRPAYRPSSVAFVPGRTVYVDSGKSSRPGIGSIIAGGVAGGVAAGATNAIVDHAISSIFRPSSNHIHTYPSAPVVGTPTVSHTTNNYYYGSGPDNNAGAPPSFNDNNNNYHNNNQPQVVGQPPQTPYGGGQSAPQNSNANVNNAQPSLGNSGGVTTGANNDGRAADPSVNSNGVVSRTPEGQAAPAPVDPNFISDEDLMKFTEELFDKQETNLGQYIEELNLQKRVTNSGQETVPDEAPEPLFKIKPELWEKPTVKTLKALYDNYQRDGTKPEILTDERRNEEAAFLDEVVKTPVMSRALEWLVSHKFVESDNFEQKAVLRRTWFANFDNTSSGFERIFLSEKFGDSGVVGMQNWIYFAHLEAQNQVDYLGYVDQLNLSGKGLLLKLNYKTDGFTIQNATIFVGTSPELELALYTICYHARSNNWCPISLGGAKFFILTHSFQYHKTELIDLGFPAF